MSLLYPITRRKWLKNKPSGFKRFVSDVEAKTKKRISKQLTYLQKKQDSLITEGDVINLNMKRNIYINARIGKTVFMILLILFMVFESILNYQNMQVAILPGSEGLLPLLARVPTAFGLTAASFIFAHIVFEILFHNMLENDKLKYNFPDTNATSTIGESVQKKAGINQAILLLVSLLLLGLTLYSIYLFSKSRSNALGQQESLDLVILALLIPPAGGLLGFLIKKNHNIIIAYRSMMRYRRIIDNDKKSKTVLVDSFTLRRAKTLNQEITDSYKKVIRFQNYLEALNYANKGNEELYTIPTNLDIDNQNQWRDRISKILEPETLRYYNSAVNNNINI